MRPLPDCINSPAPIDDKTGLPMIGDKSVAELALMSRLGRPLHDGCVPVHLCGNVRCGNPRHLTEASPDVAQTLFGVMQKDKQQRQSARRGENNSNADLNEDLVLQIKSMLQAGMTQRGIAKAMNDAYPELNLTQQNVSSIHRGRTWSHVVLDDTQREGDDVEAYFDNVIPQYLVEEKREERKTRGK